MAYNIADAYSEFKKEMDSYREIYMREGRSEAEFDEVYQFCKTQFLRDMAYYRRTQTLSSGWDDMDDEGQNPLLKEHCDALSVTMPEPCIHQYDWLDQIESPSVYQVLESFTPSELELIDLSIFKKISKAEIARMKGVDRTTISHHISRLLGKIKKVL